LRAEIIEAAVARRYLAVVAIILAMLIGLSIWRKPPLEDIRAGVEEGLSAQAAGNLKTGEAMPEMSDVGSHDWLVAVSHAARMGQKTLSWVGACKVTICQQPG
jgi:hypothetical protein